MKSDFLYQLCDKHMYIICYRQCKKFLSLIYIITDFPTIFNYERSDHHYQNEMCYKILMYQLNINFYKRYNWVWAYFNLVSYGPLQITLVIV